MNSENTSLGRVDGFDQDEAADKGHEGSVVLAVFSHRSAIRLKRLILPTACSMRARPCREFSGRRLVDGV